MGTKNKQGDFDCYANAEPDEPIFVLLARDEDAPERVRDWAKRRESKGDYRKAAEALEVAAAMEKWRIGKFGR